MASTGTLADFAPQPLPDDIPTIYKGALDPKAAQPATPAPAPKPAQMVPTPTDAAWSNLQAAQKAAADAEAKAAAYQVNLKDMPNYTPTPLDPHMKTDRWTQLGMILAGLMSRGATVPMATAEGVYQQNQQADYQRRQAENQAQYQAQAAKVEEANKTQLARAAEMERAAADRERAAADATKAFDQAERMQQAEADRQQRHSEWLQTFFEKHNEFSQRMSFAQTSLQQRLDGALQRTQLSIDQRNQVLAVRLGLADASNQVRVQLAAKQTSANAAARAQIAKLSPQLHYWQDQIDKNAAIVGNPLVDPQSDQFKTAQGLLTDARSKAQEVLDQLNTVGIDTSDATTGYQDLTANYHSEVTQLMQGLETATGVPPVQVVVEQSPGGGGGGGTDTGGAPPVQPAQTWTIKDYTTYASSLTPSARQTWLNNIKSSDPNLYAQVTQALKGKGQ